jgi:hypothetical protein
MNNYHILRIQYHGPTNHRGSRVTITSDRFKQRVTIDYDHRYSNSVDNAAAWLTERGYNLIAQGEGPRFENYLITDTFQPLKK